MLDIETLRVIWWLLLGVLFIGFAVTDGFDFGAAILFPLVARDETERRIVLNSIGPFWEGNQVWIILGAGAIFAAWPYVYAVAFSGFYFLILLLLLTMGISRPVSFKYRSKLPNIFWRRFWDWIVFIGGFCPALIFGLLIGNILAGVPFLVCHFI
jgi:cytochrome bd ubiquinol oxidase subunit II